MESNKQPTVSVIIPSYNRANFVTKAIDSVIAQTYKGYEIIVVDDGSTDDTQAILEPHKNAIRYIFQENSGVSAARNAGLRASRGKWIAFLDSDDEWLPDYLLHQMEQAEINPDVCVYLTNATMISNNEAEYDFFQKFNISKLFQNNSYVIIERPINLVVKCNIHLLPSLIVKRNALLNVGFFDTTLTIAEDFDLICRLALQETFGLSIDVLVHIYRRNEEILNLTQQIVNEGIHTRLCLMSVYEKLNRKKKTLKKIDRSILKRAYSSNMRALANLLLKTGAKNEARNIFKQAFLINPSIKSLSKYLISFLPIKIATLFIVKGKNVGNTSEKLQSQ